MKIVLFTSVPGHLYFNEKMAEIRISPVVDFSHCLFCVLFCEYLIFPRRRLGQVMILNNIE